ncbi:MULTISPECIES: acid-soluble spore protein SspM [Bacillus]|uniref:Spore protein n=1 Tax=Bacillus pumilus TaxID=1408 RepID=A0A2G8IQ91_BACPU|nr:MULTISPECIES: acid-soluble spore protein SspM [Bacillus]MCC9087545.1 spore protein [Bacillus pumilus]MED1747857.1 acid-soluble spore protein SspM [Bacillus zhangzhouensis]PIK25676.1 spore protein [Bacillus pumilus]UUD41190.1 spore protein [Bacillus pumilus]
MKKQPAPKEQKPKEKENSTDQLDKKLGGPNRPST